MPVDAHRRATGAAQKLPANADQLIEDMNLRMALMVFTYDIPRELCFAMDETFAKHQPAAISTYNKKAAPRVRLTPTY